MSSLRQVKRGVPEADVEAPADDSSSEPPETAATAFAAASASGALSPPSRGSSHNPVLIAKVIFRKVYDLLNSPDEEEDLTSAGRIINILKDIILGVILAVLVFSCVMFLDHHNIIHLKSAHNFRGAAFQLLNDPETIANLEGSSDMKFMTLSEYEDKKNEIDEVAERLASHAEYLEQRTQELDKKQKEVDASKSEYDNLMHNPILELDKFCGGCTWGIKFTCDARVEFLKSTHEKGMIPAMEFLKSTHEKGLILAKVITMEHLSCKKEG